MDYDWAVASAGTWHTMAVRTDGSLWAWGSNAFGALGKDATINNHTTPIRIGTATNWASVVAGNFFTIAIKTDGSLGAWGEKRSSSSIHGIVINYGNTPVLIQIKTEEN